MKYSSLKNEGSKTFSVSKLDGGLNLYSRPSLIENNQFCELDNMLFKNGTLKSRKGFSFEDSKIINGESNYDYAEKGLTLTDVTVEYDGLPHKIAYAVFGDEQSYAFLYAYLLSPSGNLKSIGKIGFSRTSSDIYYMFEGIVFFVGEKHTGSGIYAFVTRCNRYAESIYDAFELNSDFSVWQQLNSGDYYVPTVQINGRGNLYSTAASLREVYTEPTKYPEGFNMLTNRFKAYYTSDGSSYQFKLPVGALSQNSSVVCRVYISPSSYYEWNIYAGSDTATTATENGNVTLQCFRNAGFVTFNYTGGGVYAPPQCFNVEGNNIIITATRQAEDSLASIMSSIGCKAHNSKLFFYGNQFNPNKVYVSRINNPLYFPEDMRANVGNPTDSVTAIEVQNNKLIAFKSSEIYKIDVKSDNSGYVSLLGGEVAVFESENVACSLVHGSIGCKYRATLVVCGNRLVWLGADNEIYTLATTTYGKENNVYCLSTPLGDAIKQYDDFDTERAFAFDCDGYYVFCIYDKLYMLDYRVKNFGISSVYTALGDDAKSISWYKYSLFSHRFTSGFSLGGEMALCMTGSELQGAVIGTFCADMDKNFKYKRGVITTSFSTPVNTIKTKSFSMSNADKNKVIERAVIDKRYVGELKITLEGDSETFKQDINCQAGAQDVLVLLPHIKRTRLVSVSLQCTGELELNGIYFRYKELV